MEVCFGGRRSVGKPRVRRKNVVWRNAIDTGTERWQGGREKVGGKRSGRPRPEDLPKRHIKRKRYKFTRS
jgi:hypothetical protein